MPPPIPAHMKKLTANPSRPARYRPGKPTHQEEDSDSDEEEEEEQEKKPQKQQTKPQPRSGQRPTRAASPEEDEDDEEGFVTDEDDDDGGAKIEPALKQQPGLEQVAASSGSNQHPTIARSSQDESEQESGSEEESDDESSSEDEPPQRKFLRPTFIRKSARNAATPAAERGEQAQDQDISSSHQSEHVAARRLAEAENLIKTTIERDTAARLAGKKSWDDDDDLPPEALVDDTDGLDVEAEKSAWRLRELHRLKRDREAMIVREKELEEIERRRNLTADQRDAEDRAYIAKQKEDKESTRGQAGFLSKYHHKGAFFMDDEDSARLAQRDLIGAKFADDVDKSTLPEYMRIRDMTKLGKKGRTRYTDLKGQDTGHFGEDVKRWRGSGYTNNPTKRDGLLGPVDARFLPDDDRRNGPQASGANTSALGERRKRDRSRSRSPKVYHERRSRDQGSYRARSRSKERTLRSHSPRSRSRSPSRSHSPYRDRDKRRRMEV